jgi:hypothetical protein
MAGMTDHVHHARALNRGSWWSALLTVGILMVAWSSAANAQVNPFRGYRGPVLSQEDLAAGRAAAAKLLNEDHAEIGRSEDWTGPTSGNGGTITVQRAFKRQGMECRALRSEIRYKSTSAAPRTFNLDVCRVHTGEWKLL